MGKSIIYNILMERERIACILCGNGNFSLKYIKRSRAGQPFAIVKCTGCGLLLVNRRPLRANLVKYYSIDYFSKRDDRGYNNYLSSAIENEFLRVLNINLKCLDFFPWEEYILNQARQDKKKPKMLDIGAASGLAVNWFGQRGWDAGGVEIAKELAQQGMEKYRVNIQIGNFLDINFPKNQFDLITLFATIEHLPDPHLFIEKIQTLLKQSGRLLITTCRANIRNFRILFGRRWRFFNVPEHLFYFSTQTIESLLRKNGFKKLKIITYGSGLKPPWKATCDFLAKYLHLGDMMAIVYEKKLLDNLDADLK